MSQYETVWHAALSRHKLQVGTQDQPPGRLTVVSVLLSAMRMEQYIWLHSQWLHQSARTGIYQTSTPSRNAMVID